VSRSGSRLLGAAEDCRQSTSHSATEKNMQNRGPLQQRSCDSRRLDKRRGLRSHFTASAASLNAAREEPEVELIAAARAGDQDAFLVLMQRYQFLIRATARSYFAASAADEDLQQEALIGLVKAVRDFKSGICSFRTFAEMCIRRQVITFIKSQTRRKHSLLNTALSLDAPQYEDGEPLLNFIPGTAPPTPADEHVDFLDCLAERCSDLERKVLSLYTRGYSFEDMAFETGTHAKSIDNAVWRIKVKAKKLRAQTDLKIG
jgi:RNA polymerase sporulation-specific sigma factor